jgi:hypothetical protein
LWIVADASFESARKAEEEKAAGDEDESRLLGLHQIKELLRQKPGFAARSRPTYPLVRHASGPEAAEKLLPRLLELELFNPETDDLDSDSSGASSPESCGSANSVLGEGLKGQETPVPATTRTTTMATATSAPTRSDLTVSRSFGSLLRYQLHAVGFRSTIPTAAYSRVVHALKQSRFSEYLTN